jgi:hypothetical protein
MFRRAHKRFKPELELRMLRAFGIEQHRVVWVDEPVRVRSVWSATPMWHNADPLYVHPHLERTWGRLTDGLLDEPPDVETCDRIFVSRGSRYRDRSCRNLDEVAERFARHGFRVVYPEQHSLAEQALIFRRAAHVAGLGVRDVQPHALQGAQVGGGPEPRRVHRPKRAPVHRPDRWAGRLFLVAAGRASVLIRVVRRRLQVVVGVRLPAAR